ncbi:MAG: TetR/AcrR family transcriptional regulator [Bacteroidales bacterium]|nr:TetR/AcrR family transcriptional regulator [Bacteroidales bacterium]
MTNKSTELMILEAAEELFFRYGYSKTSVDDITESIRISKKTLYQNFESKEKILVAIFDSIKTELSTQIEKIIADKSIPFTDKLRESMRVISRQFSKIPPFFYDDIQYQAPEVWKMWLDYKKDAAFRHFRYLLEEGKSTGDIKPEISIDMTVFFYLSALHSMLDPKFIKHQLPSEVADNLPDSPLDRFNEVVRIVYLGILTDKSKQELEKK